MLDQMQILIVDDDATTAKILDAVIREADGMVLGPCPTVQQALQMVLLGNPSAAIVRMRLKAGGDIAAVLEALAVRGIPAVLQSSPRVPSEITGRFGHLPLLATPIVPDDLVGQLLMVIEDAHQID